MLLKLTDDGGQPAFRLSLEADKPAPVNTDSVRRYYVSTSAKPRSESGEFVLCRGRRHVSGWISPVYFVRREARHHAWTTRQLKEIEIRRVVAPDTPLGSKY